MDYKDPYEVEFESEIGLLLPREKVLEALIIGFYSEIEDPEFRELYKKYFGLSEERIENTTKSE